MPKMAGSGLATPTTAESTTTPTGIPACRRAVACGPARRGVADAEPAQFGLYLPSEFETTPIGRPSAARARSPAIAPVPTCVQARPMVATATSVASSRHWSSATPQAAK